MKAVMADVSEDFLKQRKVTGADRYDEMWDGVLHMPPMPNRFHQDLNWALETYLRLVWIPTRVAKVHHDVNVTPVGGWPHNYRAPDLIILLPERYEIDQNEYFEGGPNVVVEIHSPGDEAYDKLPFYAALGVAEVWIIHRNTCEPELYQLRRNRYKKKSASPEGWLRSAETGIELRRGDGNKLAIRLAGDETTRQDLPPD
jgi:Uma2 family endonuclease